MALKDLAIKKISAMLGIEPDASLPELVQFANDNFDAGITLQTVPLSQVSAIEELTLMGRAAEAAIEGGRVGQQYSFYRVRIEPPGKAPCVAFVVMGPEPAKSS